MRFRRRAGGVTGGLALLFALPAVLFFLRSPVLILTDGPFDALYGVSRARKVRAAVSLRLFRPVKPVRAAETAGSDAILLMLEAASSRPYCVLFPWRYEEGARRYADEFPSVPVFVLGTGEGSAGGAGAAGQERPALRYVETDTETDFYRAGRCAAILAGTARRRILVFQRGPAPRGRREAFVRGLRDEGNDSEPRYPDIADSVSVYQDVSVAVLAAKPGNFLEQNLPVPAILFSWLDPALSPREMKVVFDDSPWAMAVRAVKMAKTEERVLRIPSAVRIPPDRIADGETLRRLKEAIRAPFPE
jgi:hypothetical protein